jgi:subtilisin family serine protease
MKTKNYITVILLLISLSINAQEKFYYAFNQKVFLNTVPNKHVIEFKNTPDERFLKKKGLEKIKIAKNVYEFSGKINQIKDLINDEYQINPLFKTEDNLLMYIKGYVILRWNEDTSEVQKEKLIKKFNLKKTKTTRLYEIFKNVNSLETSQKIYESGLVYYSHPEFISKVEKFEHIPNDEYFSNQFYLHNTGQQLNDNHFGTTDADIDAPEAWDITKGNSNIVIAIVDEGVTNNHPDLPASRQIRLTGSNFNPDDGLSANDPSPHNNGNHGNSCAGIVGAEMDNSQGVTGIAPECKIMPIKIPFGNYSAQIYADAITLAANNGANVISNSWGYGSTNPNLFPEIVTAIEDAINQGSVVLFAAGNTAHHINGNQGSVNFPANSNIPLLITVGASDRNDLQANYSPTSNLIDIVAPSHTAYNSQINGEAFNIWTIDMPGNDGYNTWNSSWSNPLPAVGEILPATGTNHLSYTGRMGGTSAATPEVAAVIALVLSLDSTLSVEELVSIILNSTDKVGGYDYNWDSNNTGHSQELGFGRLNAHNALLETISILNSGRRIIGQNQLTPGLRATYRLSTPHPNATHYTWTIPNGCYYNYCWEIINGQGTTSLSISAGSTGIQNIECKIFNGSSQIGSNYIMVNVQNPYGGGGGGGNDPCGGLGFQEDVIYPPIDDCDTENFGTNNSSVNIYFKKVVIYNFIGQVVLETKEKEQANISHLSSGIYIIKAELSNNKIMTKKIYKK